MPPDEEEIRRRLKEFAARWGGYAGSERSEAQTFLNQLLDCFGVDRQAAGARFEERTGDGFMDLFWPGVCIVEMKRPSEVNRLAVHRAQAVQYWQNSGTPSKPAPRYVVLCAFHRFEVWEPGAVYTEPRAIVDLVELPDNLEALLFLAGRDPLFGSGGAELTREAVALVTDLYQRLRERRAADLDVLRDFILQCIWSMFAEDLHMIPSHIFTRVLARLRNDPSRSSADDLGRLFEVLATPGERPAHGLYADTPYANGSLFVSSARVHLEQDEVDLLLQAAENFKLAEGRAGDLRRAAPGSARAGTTVGAGCSLHSGGGHPEDRSADGGRAVAGPHRRLPDACRRASGTERLDELCRPRSGVRFRELPLRRLPRAAADRGRAPPAGGRHETERRIADQQSLAVYFPLSNMKGIELDPFAVQLARVTLWMGHKLAVDELALDETVLPLVDLSGIHRADALRSDWPRADAVIGNPPYHGTKLLRSELGDDYVEWLRGEFKVGVKDYAVYWFRKAHDHLQPQKRAGLVATNSIAEGRNRQAALDYIAGHGGVITSAVSSQDWPGEANVHVSIVNWIRGTPEQPLRTLDGLPVAGITTTLRAGVESDVGSPLRANEGRQFYGVVPTGNGFILAPQEAESLIERSDADYREVVRPYLSGDDITSNPEIKPRRWIIDFGERSLEEAMKWPAALAIVRERVKPGRDVHKKRRERMEWWKFSRSVRELFDAVVPLPRFIACPAQAKSFFMVWCETNWCPSNTTSAFAFDDDFSIGVLSSSIHARWAKTQSTSLETRPRYTVASFMTFPWPPVRPNAVGDAARALVSLRKELAHARDIGLTKLYNEVAEGAHADLQALHDELDEAVASAYGWPPGTARDQREVQQRLLEINRAIAAGELEYTPFE